LNLCAVSEFASGGRTEVTVRTAPKTAPALGVRLDYLAGTVDEDLAPAVGKAVSTDR
jgi:hypothetical protein